jgi:hypothetical protein
MALETKVAPLNTGMTTLTSATAPPLLIEPSHISRKYHKRAPE